MHSVLDTIKRSLPAGIPLVLVAISAIVFEFQNHTKISQKENFLLITDDQLAVQYQAYHTGDAERRTFIGPEFLIPVAKKTVLTKRAGLGFYDRGHNSSFEAELPEFLIDSPFLKKLSQQLCEDYKQSAIDFTRVDWSLVLDGFREPLYSPRNWEGMIHVNFAHVTPNAVSLVQFYWEYTGGAHGNGSLQGQCFVDNQGSVRQLMLEDLFDAGSNWEQRLIDYCVSDLRRQGASFISNAFVQTPESATTSPENLASSSANLSLDEEDLDADAITDDSETGTIAAENMNGVTPLSTSDLTSFTLSPAGLRFYFSPYHVGSYAEGIYTVGVPYSVIRECIPDDSPARLFMTTNAHSIQDQY